MYCVSQGPPKLVVISCSARKRARIAASAPFSSEYLSWTLVQGVSVGAEDVNGEAISCFKEPLTPCACDPR